MALYKHVFLVLSYLAFVVAAQSEGSNHESRVSVQSLFWAIPYDQTITNVDSNGIALAEVTITLSSAALVEISTVVDIYDSIPQSSKNSSERIRLMINGEQVFQGTNGGETAEAAQVFEGQQLSILHAAVLGPGMHEISLRGHIMTGLGGSLRWSDVRGSLYAKAFPLQVTGDLDGDGDVDLADYTRFQAQFTGPLP